MSPLWICPCIILHVAAAGSDSVVVGVVVVSSLIVADPTMREGLCLIQV